MAVFSSIYAPNRITVAYDDNVTDPQIIAMDGTGYADLATLLGAGKTPWPFGNATTPGLDPGMFLQSCSAENVTDPTKSFAVAWNTATVPDGDSMTLIPGGIPQFTFPGAVWNVWISKEVGTNHIVLTGLY